MGNIYLTIDTKNTQNTQNTTVLGSSLRRDLTIGVSDPGPGNLPQYLVHLLSDFTPFHASLRWFVHFSSQSMWSAALFS